ncbi:hypothetical protein D3C85_1527030 [compost metagenome]
MRLKSILTGSNENTGPVCIMLPMMAATIATAKNGPRSMSAARKARSIVGQSPAPEASRRLA